MCVYIFAIYVCIYNHKCTHSGFHGKLKLLRLWVFIHHDIWEGKEIITYHKFLNWGKVNTTVNEGHISCVYTNTHIYTDLYINTYIPIIWNIHILTHLLWTLSHYIIYSPSWKQSFPHLTQATGDCLLSNWSGISKKALILSQQNGMLGSQFYFQWLLFKFSRPNPVNTFT